MKQPWILMKINGVLLCHSLELYVPEVPTMYSQGGWSYLTPNPKLYYEGELAILQTQLALEDSFMRLAETCTKPTFVVCDRGTMDISAYISPEMWLDITAKCGTCSNQLRERYDAVLHLVSAADGAEQYYRLTMRIAMSRLTRKV